MAKTTGKTLQDILEIALGVLNKQLAHKQTPDTIQAYRVYPGERIVVIISDYRKFSLTWAELGLEGVEVKPEETATKAGIPETTIKK